MNQHFIHPSTEQTTDLKLSGINIKEGLERAADDIEIYRQILEMFYNCEFDRQNQLKTHLANADTEQALQVLHSIKGSAGNIGANDLSNAAQKLEQGLKDQLTELDSLILDFHTQFDLVFNSLNAYLKPEHQGTVANNDLSAAEANALINALPPLIGALEAYDTAALKQLTEISPLFASQPETFDKIQQSINDFEFDQALEILHELQSVISAELK